MSKDKKLQWFYEQIVDLRNDLFYFAYSIMRSIPESEDAVSSAIIKAHIHIDSLRNRRALKPWLFSIVRNECYSMSKARQRTISIDTDIAFYCEAGSEQKIDVGNALMNLPQEQRMVITLYYICGHSVKEVAEILEIPPGTVKSRLSRARSELKKVLGDEYHEA